MKLIRRYFRKSDPLFSLRVIVGAASVGGAIALGAKIYQASTFMDFATSALFAGSVLCGLLILYNPEVFIDWIIKSRRQRKGGRKRITRNPPGAVLLSVAEFLYSRKTVELTFEVLIADFRLEYFEALKQKRSVKCAWIRVRYFFLFIANMGLSKLWSVFSAIRQVTK